MHVRRRDDENVESKLPERQILAVVLVNVFKRNVLVYFCECVLWNQNKSASYIFYNTWE